MQKLAIPILIFTAIFTTNIYGKESTMVLIPAGKLNIGNSNKLIHLDPFYIDKTEVTQKEYMSGIQYILYYTFLFTLLPIIIYLFVSVILSVYDSTYGTCMSSYFNNFIETIFLTLYGKVYIKSADFVLL